MPLILPSQRVIRPNPLAYPAGAVPGINFSHPASSNLIVSAIPGGSGYVNLATGASLTAINGSVAPTNGVDASIGPSNYNPLASAAFDYGVNLSQTVTQLTFAAILRPVSLASSYQGVLTFNSSTGGLYLNSGVVDYYFGGDHGNISLTVGTPYFIAASAGSITNIVVKNLSTGQVYTFTNVGTFGSTSLSNIAISLASNQSGSYISSAMSSATNLSMQQLLQWAKSPWEFWYPNKTINLASSAASAGASFLPVWAYRYNLPVLGTGNF